MYLLKRTISPYTGEDILLGCYRNLQDAQGARNFYVSQYTNNEKDDPWKEQAYHTVDFEQDVVILDNIPEFDVNLSNDAVLIVTSVAEGFGQIIRQFHAICGSADAARIKMTETEKEFEGHWPTAYQIRKVVVGQLLSDDKDRMDITPHIKALEKLKKSKDLRTAEKFLIDLIAYNETKNVLDGLGVPIWYYFELAKLYRQQKNYSKEIAILEKYASQKYVWGGISTVLLERLAEVRKLLASKSNSSR